MYEEDHCMTLLCSFPNSWDNLVMAIGSTVKTLVLHEVVASLFSEEMRKKSSETTSKALSFSWNIKEEKKEERK
jgi:hypothetical protein